MNISRCTTIIEYDYKPNFLDICDGLLDYPSLLLGGRKVRYIDSEFILSNDLPKFREIGEENNPLTYLVALAVTIIFCPLILIALMIKWCSTENDRVIEKLELFDKQTEVATKIQRAVRVFLTRNMLKKERETKAAIKIQAVARGFIVRNRLKKEQEASQSGVTQLISPIYKGIRDVIGNSKPFFYKGVEYLFKAAVHEGVKELIYIPIAASLGVSYADVKFVSQIEKLPF